MITRHCNFFSQRVKEIPTLYHLQIRVETLEPMSMLAISVNNL